LEEQGARGKRDREEAMDVRGKGLREGKREREEAIDVWDNGWREGKEAMDIWGQGVE